MGALYTGSFELRRLVVRFVRTPTGGISEDAAMFTFHFAKLTGGAIDPAWTSTDYGQVEARFDTWWTGIKGQFPPTTTLAEYRWYKDGDAWSPIDRGDGPPNPADRSTARSVAGTGVTAAMSPPQVAATITKVVDVRKRWGRIYLPTPTGASFTSDGRIISGFQSSLVSLMVTCLNGCRTDGKRPVVWSRARSAYTTSRGASIPAHPASAYEITAIEADNLADIQRSRRYSVPTVRSSTNLT